MVRSAGLLICRKISLVKQPVRGLAKLTVFP